jgi:HAD superfamily hydrolase (TIGR01490 family)
MKSAAFFDLDNTLIRGSSLFHLAKGLKKHEFFTKGEVRFFIRKHLKYIVLGKEVIRDLNAIKDIALQIAAGHKLDDVERIAIPVVDEYLMPKVYEETRALGLEHIAAGREVWIVTAAPWRLADVLAKRLGFTGALGSVGEVVDGVLTGKMIGNPMHGKEKGIAVSKLAAERGWNLAECFAYSDSANDLPMLEAVGTAIAVNPDRRLRSHAKRAGWKILDFRRSRFARKFNPLNLFSRRGRLKD